MLVYFHYSRLESLALKLLRLPKSKIVTSITDFLTL